jgi:hypothetical protein
MEVDKKVVLGGISEQVYAVLHCLLFIAVKEVNFDAGNAN